MIDALDMRQVPMAHKPDPSHRFGAWTSTTVACASDDRFGQVRVCKRCGGREVKAGGAGSHYFDESLTKKCGGRR